jgi:hypothetical protein
MRARTKRLLRRYWGWLTFAVAIIGWFSGFAWPVLIALSLVSAIYFLLDVPLWCGATTREYTRCRRNSTGLLRGCSLDQHKWQRLTWLVTPAKWRELNDGLWATPKESLATLAALATVFSFAGSVIGAAG